MNIQKHHAKLERNRMRRKAGRGGEMNIQKHHAKLERNRMRRKAKRSSERRIMSCLPFIRRANPHAEWWAAPDGSVRWLGDLS